MNDLDDNETFKMIPERIEDTDFEDVCGNVFLGEAMKVKVAGMQGHNREGGGRCSQRSDSR